MQAGVTSDETFRPGEVITDDLGSGKENDEKAA
jgi:hypothetical protein